ncbi:O-linked N-acetylglucosamine transferase family protein [Oceanibaculum indicum]|uniref:O-GlcNAc transferase C-terminal domain-containing protein n=1 Tax=Oceanibaculum indicum P24 TaxID=1207063 RepID=K2JAZ1_9PROT|nr:hypothetical protein [Oceanibaculum indicum]EKE72298.1 hypothetical protein P24_14030 [Oceanibaculum indicum P24]
MSPPLPAFRRIALARRWLTRNAAEAEASFRGPEGKTLLAALDAPPLRWPDAPELLEEAVARLRHADTPAARAAPLLAGLLLAEPYRLPPLDPIAGLPVWLGPALFRTLARGPDFFREPGDPERWARWAENLLDAIEAAPPARHPDAFALLEALRLHAAFAGTGDLRSLMARRGKLIARFSHAEEWIPPRRDDGQIRLGLLAMRLDDRPNTRFLLPHLAGLDRKRFVVTAYGLAGEEDNMAALARLKIGRVKRLDGMSLAARVAAIRNDRLDVLLVGGNVAAAIDPLARLAAHRLAPVQIALAASPVTTGLPGMTHFLVGSETPPEAENHYTEQPVRLDRPFCCFAPSLAQEVPPLTRASLGIPAEATLLLSTANLMKLTAETLGCWLALLAEAENTVLLLAPFNPFWTGPDAPVARFRQHVEDRALAQGVARWRVRLAGPFAEAGSLTALAGMADIFLDAFPYAGCTSLLAPLAASLPVVTMRGTSQRGNQAAAMLEALRLGHLVARNDAEYRRIALRLTGNPAERQHIGDAIRRALPAAPFLDGAGFARSLDAMLSAMIAENRGRVE